MRERQNKKKQGGGGYNERHYVYYYYYYYYGDETEEVHCSEGSQAVPVRASGKGSLQTKYSTWE
jgi:hypothetical protein